MLYLPREYLFYFKMEKQQIILKPILLAKIHCQQYVSLVPFSIINFSFHFFSIPPSIFSIFLLTSILLFINLLLPLLPFYPLPHPFVLFFLSFNFCLFLQIINDLLTFEFNLYDILSFTLPLFFFLYIFDLFSFL